jgi:hypothetical protein
VIDFSGKTLDEASSYPEALDIVRQRVKPVRDTLPDNKKRVRDAWWRFEYEARDMRAALLARPLAFARSRLGDTHAFVRIGRSVVPSDRLVVVVADTWAEFGVLQSSIHDLWVWARPALHENRMTYNPTMHFETFPFPAAVPSPEIAETFHELRREVAKREGEGLTKLARRINAPDYNDGEIRRLRECIVKLDEEVVAAYGWDDIDLGHGHCDTRFGSRFTLAPFARREVLNRLLVLNQERGQDAAAE